MFHVRPDRKGFAGNIGIAHHVMDSAVTEGKITFEGMMAKVPAPMFRVLESSKYTFTLPDSKLYFEKAPPYNRKSRVFPRKPDGQPETVVLAPLVNYLQLLNF